MSALDRVTGSDWHSLAEAPPPPPFAANRVPSHLNKQTARTSAYGRDVERRTGFRLSESKSQDSVAIRRPFLHLRLDNRATLCYTISYGSYG